MLICNADASVSIYESGFEHHVASSMSSVAASIEEALSKYMGWSVYRH
ncbi:MAG TPA: hypothetical protein VGE40_06485 [Bacilli bacterium]